VATQLDPLSLGIVLAILGMGGTLLTLFGLSLVVDLLKRLFPTARELPTPKGPAVGQASATAPETRDSEAGTT
jgi:Na+-transporting methylmalonyl-CoA/oxaloacetate decarboxylase gamma subunit